MDENSAGKLQIFSIEERRDVEATCIVRCVGGVVRPGQTFDAGSANGATGAGGRITLDRLDRYGRQVDFVDPPHNAKVHFSGEGVAFLTEGITITSVEV